MGSAVGVSMPVGISFVSPTPDFNAGSAFILVHFIAEGATGGADLRGGAAAGLDRTDAPEPLKLPKTIRPSSAAALTSTTAAASSKCERRIVRAGAAS